MTLTKERGGPATAAPSTTPESAKQSKRRCTCKCHCPSCDRHFASLDAFDAHRKGSHTAPRLSLDGRRCVGPEHDSRKRFELALGVCKIGGGGEQEATIWRLANDAEKARRRFGTVESGEAAVAA